jgi:hypothetical protein
MAGMAVSFLLALYERYDAIWQSLSIATPGLTPWLAANREMLAKLVARVLSALRALPQDAVEFNHIQATAHSGPYLNADRTPPAGSRQLRLMHANKLLQHS